MKKLIPEIITIGIILIGVLCYPFVSRGLQYAPPFLFSGLRTMIAGISILFILPMLRQPVFPPRDIWKWILLFSIPAVVITYGTMFLSHGGTGMATIPVLENLQPFLAVILATLFIREKLSSATRIVLIFGTVGLLLLSVQAFAGNAAFDFQRAILALLASLSAATASILAKGIKRPDAIVTISAWQFIIGSVPLFILSGLFEKSISAQFDTIFWAILLFLAIIGTATTTVVWYILIQKVDVSRLSVLFFLLPAFGLLAASALYAVPISLFEWVGIITILIGVIIGIKKQSVSTSHQNGNKRIY